MRSEDFIAIAMLITGVGIMVLAGVIWDPVHEGRIQVASGEWECVKTELLENWECAPVEGQ